MKVRRKPKPRYEIGKYPKKGTPEYEELTPHERKLAGLAPKFQPGNKFSLGRKPGNTGNVVYFLRRLLKEPSGKEKFETVAHELAGTILKRARRGHVEYVRMILDKTESKTVTRDDLETMIEQLFNIVADYVDDDKIRSQIAIAFSKLTQKEDE